MDESRSNSLVVINNDQLKSLSKSRPKQRHPKLIDDKDKVNSILKMLEKSHKIELPKKHPDHKSGVPSILAVSEDQELYTERSKGK